MVGGEVQNTDTVLVSPEQFALILSLYDRGLYLQAYRIGEQIAPLGRWRGTAARILAGRLAGNLGSGRLADWHFLRAWRADPFDCEACWYYGRHLLDRRGPWKAWQFLKQRGDIPDAPLDSRSHWYSLHADVLGRVRDFAAAESWLDRADALGANHPWTHLSRAALLSQQDRHDEAMTAARQALTLRPGYRPAIQWLAHFLVQKEADAEAEALLVDATQKMESCGIWSQLGNLQFEQGRYADARASLEEVERLAPLKDKDMVQWLAARRSDVAYYCGDHAAALTFASQVKGRFFETIAARLKDPPEARRVVLPVPYVRQHFDTCAPATLASICRFWSMPGDHLELAAAITYAGTPNHSERQWAEDHGWKTREFTVTWESCQALIDRGIPFTLTTPEPHASHLQAVMGYDNLRGTVLLRDPRERQQVEMLAAALPERYGATGPRGHALVPAAESERLAGSDLPDTEFYDLRHQMDRALEAHQRERAGELCRKLEEKAPGHQIALSARRTLANYDLDIAQELACTEQLLALYPNDLCLQLARVYCLRELARHEDLLQQLKKLCEQENTHPTCWQQYAQELADDARTHPEALYWLRRALRSDPREARSYHCLARISWTQRRLEESLELSRFAACLEEKDEFFARIYFSKARSIGRTGEAMAFLRERFARFGKKSGWPGRTLCWACFELEQATKAFAVLDEALALRPEDGDLLLYAVDQWMYHGEFDRATELLNRAEGRTRPADWLRSAARLKASRGDLRSARDLWGNVLQIQPLATDAHSAYCQLLAETDGRQSALRHIEEACARFPHNFPLHRLWRDWLGEDGPAAIEPVVRKLIDIHPADGWARRELAIALVDQRRLDEALAEMEVAAQVEPACVPLYTVKAYVLSQAGRIAEAKECYREALRLSADSDVAINEWIALCDTQAERREVLAFVEEEMKRQPLSGDGLLAYRQAGLITLEREELLASLQRALDARPDLWQAWAAVVRQLRDMDRFDDALQVATQAVDRFSLLPAVWVDLAGVHLDRKDDAAAETALKRALHINPDWNVPLRRLTELYERQGRAGRAKTLLRKAIARSPLVAEHHYTLAVLLWNTGQREQALARMQRALGLEAGYVSAWDAFLDWAAELQQLDKVIDYARGLTEQRSGEARSWMRLAEALRRLPEESEKEHTAHLQECLAAIDRAIALNPHLVDAYDQKAVILAELRRFREAEAACRTPIWDGRPPLTLRGRLAWLLAERGQLNRAVKTMQTAVEEDPNYLWGWRQLADWNDQRYRAREHLRAAEQLVQLTPDDAAAWAHRGLAFRRLKDLDAARADYEHALELSPDYRFPAFQLFDMYLEARDFKNARVMLRKIKSIAEWCDYIRRALRLHALAGNRAKACKYMVSVCCSWDDYQDCLTEAVDHFREACWERDSERMLWERLEFGRRTSKLWLEVARRRGRSWRELVRRVGRLPRKEPDRQRNAVVALAEALADAGKQAAVRSLVKRHEKLLRADLSSWGLVGHFFSQGLDDRRVVEWFSDWRERPDAECWMLMNLSLALIGVNRWDEAEEVHRSAVAKAPDDYTRKYHETWLAFGAALAGDVAAVREFFEKNKARDLDPNHQWIAALTRAVRIADTGRDKAKASARARKVIANAARRIAPIDRDACFAIAFRMARRRIAAACGIKWASTKGMMPKRKGAAGSQ